MSSLKQIVDIAQEMVVADKTRDEMLMAMDNMWESRWSLPANLTALKWVHKVVSTDPHDAIRSGTRILSSTDPKINFTPLGPNDQDTANRLERSLSWHFKNASRRRRASILRDVVLSALLYDEIVAQVVYLPHQIEAMQSFEGDTGRLEAAKRYGPFSIIVRNPQQVHTRYSDYMPEAVLMKRLMPVKECVAFWCTKAGKIEAKAKESAGKTGQEMFVSVYDYHDLNERKVWATLSPNQVLTPPDDKSGVTILDEKNKLGFLPWVARVGGSTLFDEGTLQRVPMLWSLYKAGQWDTQNISETLMASQVIAYAAAPRLKTKTFDKQGVEVDYNEPGGQVNIAPGEEVEEMNPPQIEANLLALADRISNRVSKSTVPNVLTSGEFPAGTAFATLNLATQSGLRVLAPYKELAELGISDILTQMLYWVDFRDEPLTSYYEKDGRTEQLTITKNDFDVQNLYINVELTADVPTDRVQRINAATLALQSGLVNKQQAANDIGNVDFTSTREQGRVEALEDNEFQLALFKRQSEVQREEQLITQKALMELQMQAQQVQMEQQAQQEQGMQEQMAREGGQGFENLRGQGFSPNQGGAPPAQGNPEGTRETQTGVSFTGEELV